LLVLVVHIMGLGPRRARREDEELD
jgi:hypothetical protein